MVRAITTESLLNKNSKEKDTPSKINVTETPLAPSKDSAGYMEEKALGSLPDYTKKKSGRAMDAESHK